MAYGLNLKKGCPPSAVDLKVPDSPVERAAALYFLESAAVNCF